MFLSGQIENALCRRSFDEAQLCLYCRGLRLQGGAVEILLPQSPELVDERLRVHRTGCRRIRNQRNPVHRVAQDEFAFVFVREFGREIHGSVGGFRAVGSYQDAREDAHTVLRWYEHTAGL